MASVGKRIVGTPLGRDGTGDLTRDKMLLASTHHFRYRMYPPSEISPFSLPGAFFPSPTESLNHGFPLDRSIGPVVAGPLARTVAPRYPAPICGGFAAGAASRPQPGR